jgi:uncharacterized membrane protein
VPLDLAGVLEWSEYAAAFACFLLSHILPAQSSVRSKLVKLLGSRGYLALYVGVALIVLWWLIDASERAPLVVLWYQQPWQRWVPIAVMPVVCLLLAFAIGAPNPLSFGGARSGDFDPNNPGIVGIVRHPILWAIIFWAASHVVPNGDLAHVMLFGTFVGLSFLGMMILDRRKRKQLSFARWDDLARLTSNNPFRAADASLLRAWSIPEAMWRFLIALLIYVSFLIFHEIIIGVSPHP